MRFTNATTDINNWDFNDHHVQAEMVAGEFMSSDSTLISAGAPSLDQVLGDPDAELGSGVVYPIGVTERFSMGQQQQLQPVFEIGSSRAYFVPGKNVGTLQIGRVLFAGPSLLKVLYAYYRQTNTAAKFLFNHRPKGSIIGGTPGQYVKPDPNAAMLDIPGVQESLPAITDRPGYGDYFINLGSDLFKQPIGLMMYIKDSLDQPYGGGYIENAHIASHQMSVQAGSGLLVESVSIQFDRVVPVNVGIANYVPASANA